MSETGGNVPDGEAKWRRVPGGLRALGPFLRDAWRLAQPYFRSEERWSARGLLLAIIAMNLFLVAMDVVMNFWNGAFFDSIQAKDWHSFIQLLFLYHRSASGIMPGFSLIATVYILVAVYRTYLNQWLQIRWRRWMTGQFLDHWLADRAYYHISLATEPASAATDNPDQRIADDLRSFCTDTLSLGLDLLSNVVSMFSFISILWALSGPMRIHGISIPGYLVWVALVYSVLGTWLTHLVGRPLAALRFRQQRVEADFRFSMARLRENTEGVALYHGEATERHSLGDRFASVVVNWWQIMRRVKFLNALTAGYNQVANIFPIVVAAPRYFSGAIALGGLTRISNSFGQVQGAMSWLVGAYDSLASWRATVERLATFDRALVAARAGQRGPTIDEVPGTALTLHGVRLALPDGSELLPQTDLVLQAGEPTLIQGRSGTGKSTLFRAIAGIWPFGDGQIARPAGKYLFLPQRPYLPLGTLRHAVTYPGTTTLVDGAAEAALVAVGLPHLVDDLDTDASWSQRLSGGEQQRLAFARALLNPPDWLFLDEATSALDAQSETEMYALLHQRLPNTTIVSIAHHANLAETHLRRLFFQRDGAALARIVATEG